MSLKLIFLVFCYFSPIPGILGKSVPARDVGVKCNGRSDDTDALNAAIKGLSDGDSLILPENSICPTTGNLEIFKKKNIAIKSEGQGSKILARRAANSAIKIKDSEWIRFENFELIVPYSRSNIWHPNAAGLVIEDSSNIRVFRVKVSKTSDIGILVTRSRDILIQENEISETYQNGIHVDFSTNVRLIENHLTDIKRHGISVRPRWAEENAHEKPSKHLQILGNLINRTDITGISLDTAEDVLVAGNRIYGTFSTGISLSDWHEQSGDLAKINITYNIVVNSPREKHENNKWDAALKVQPNKRFMEHIFVEKNLLRDPKARVPPPHKTFAMVFWTENSGFIDDLRVIDNTILDVTKEIECMNGMSRAAIGEILVKGNTKNKVDCPSPNEPNAD